MARSRENKRGRNRSTSSLESIKKEGEERRKVDKKDRKKSRKESKRPEKNEKSEKMNQESPKSSYLFVCNNSVSRKKRSKKPRAKHSDKYYEIRKNIRDLSSYSSESSVDSYQKEKERDRKKKQLRKKYYKKDASSDEDPLEHYKKRQFKSKDNQVWDGFRWVEKDAPLTGLDQNAIVHAKKMRRVLISNLPIYLGLRQADIKAVVSSFLISKCLVDKGNNDPVIECELNQIARTAIVELTSIREADLFSKVNFISILSVRCKVERVGESMYGESVEPGRMMVNAIKEAESRAIAQKEFELLQESGVIAKKNHTRTIKVHSLCDPEHAKVFTSREFDKIFEDIYLECSRGGTIENAFIIKNHNCSIGAEPGCVFLETASQEDSGKVLESMKGKKYEGRKFEMTCIPEETYAEHFKRLQT